jgi:lipopolysaccharide kinase (Kdo/WaaP) family protein
MSVGEWWQRWTRGERRFLHREDWPRFAGADFGDQIMTAAVTDRHHTKQGRSIGRWTLRHDGDELVVYLKRHYRSSWWRRVMAFLWPAHGWSAAFGEWRRLQWAKARGIPVPEPVAVGEFIGPGLRLQSFLALKELAGMLPLHEAIPRAAVDLPCVVFRAWKRRVIAQVAELTRVLHEHQHFHKDLYLCHFYVQPPASGRLPAEVGTVHMIDFHRLAHHPFAGWVWRIKDLAQLLFSSDVSGVTERDRLRFLHRYLGLRKLNRAGRRLLSLVSIKARMYQRKHEGARDLRLAPQLAARRPAHQETVR